MSIPVFRKHVFFSIVGVATLILGGCATPCCPPGLPPSPLVASPAKLTAVGYGNMGAYSQYTQGQRKLMAIRAAQIDAYRNLAEQVYGFRVWGNSAVSAFATQNDSVRTYVDAFIRGAKVVNTTAIADENYEVTVELDITPAFLHCFNGSATCFTQPLAPPVVPSCVTYGCVQPSATYYSY